jgi:hypothetical protein
MSGTGPVRGAERVTCRRQQETQTVKAQDIVKRTGVSRPNGTPKSAGPPRQRRRHDPQRHRRTTRLPGPHNGFRELLHPVSGDESANSSPPWPTTITPGSSLCSGARQPSTTQRARASTHTATNSSSTSTTSTPSTSTGPNSRGDVSFPQISTRIDAGAACRVDYDSWTRWSSHRRSDAIRRHRLARKSSSPDRDASRATIRALNRTGCGTPLSASASTHTVSAAATTISHVPARRTHFYSERVSCE